jgi:ubiquinone/menaquinone biosynthesis C-methylase UbiE/uncharacterized protein YbaR (Trm112 family)
MLEAMACPYDHASLRAEDGGLACTSGHRFPVVDGIPVLLRDDVSSSHGAAQRSMAQARGEAPLDWDAHPHGAEEIDPFVQEAIGATNGIMYVPLIGRLKRYPIPVLRLPPGAGKRFLDIGCNWGRWTMAAARAGHVAVGVDPSLEAVRAARRVARQLGLRAAFACADARHLPFRDGQFDQVFSYSVLQHFSREDLCDSLREVRRVLVPGGACLIQMANALGVRSLYHLLRRARRSPTGFDVRYWTPAQLQRTFSDLVGNTELLVDGFFTLNAQPSDLDILPRHYRGLVRLSQALTALSRRFNRLGAFADSLYVSSTRS